MKDRDRLLVRVLAASDAMRLPLRDWSGRASANRYLGLKTLAAAGVPLRMGGADADRQAAGRTLDELARDELVTLTQHGRGKFPHVRLTPAGDARARALAGLPDRAVGLMFLSAIAARGDKYLHGCPEVALPGAGNAWGKKATAADRRILSEVELDFLAAAAQGWAVALSSVSGNAIYAVTEAGRVELESPSSAPPFDLPDEDGAARRLYRTEQDAALRELHTTKSPTPEIGPLPLPHCELLLTKREAAALA